VPEAGSLAKARRIAARVHRGQYFHGDGLFVDHLDRVARILAGAGASRSARQAGYLYAVGLPSLRLYRAGVPAGTVGIVETLRQGVGEGPEPFTDRLLRHPDAATVRWAVLTDLSDHSSAGTRYRWWRPQHVRLAEALGRPTPPARPDDEISPVAPPGPDDHLGPYARYLGARGDVAGLMAMHEAERGRPARSCCRAAVQHEIYTLAARPDSLGSEPVRRMSQEWWDSPDDWRCTVAVTARSSGDRRVLLSKVDLSRPTVTAAAVAGLSGPGDAEEIAVLARVVASPGPDLRRARRAATARLAEIGGPSAAAALAARPLDPVDPPYRDDPTWFDAQGPDVVDVLIGKLADPEWWHEAPRALGHLRAVAAVPALCEKARSTGGPWVPAIEALGRIGSPDAVPTLVGLVDHPTAAVRDGALRALNRIGGPEAVDAAVRACDDPDPEVRDRAARVLTRHGDERAVATLVRLCDTVHVGRAVSALVRIGDPRALPTLWHLFLTAADRGVRHAAGRGLAAIDGPLRHVGLAYTSVPVRRAYVWLLGRRPDWHGHDVVRRALSDDDPLVRAHAVVAIGRLGHRAAPLQRPGDPDDGDRISAMLGDPDPRVRTAARYSRRARPSRMS
jgi:HEAT repeat protein